MRYIEPTRVKVLMMMFYATGTLGIVIGLTVASGGATLMITFLGVINIGLGAFFTFLLLTQTQTTPDKRKKKRKSD
jgi:hypothetical protein